MVYIALLRGINVGGTGILAMKELAGLCGDAGFGNVRTYIQSGNVIFESDLREDAVRQKLEAALQAKMGKRIDVHVRTAKELRAALESNPFADKEPGKVAVVFLAGKPPAEALRSLVGPAGEQVHAGAREVYVFYPEGMGRSKLKLPAEMKAGTVRNVNTVAKLVALAEA